MHFDAAPPASLGHLEIETKHGFVLLFDHRSPVVYACPPAPQGRSSRRRWQDLTLAVPEAFDERPLFTGVRLSSRRGSPCWIFDMSTGARFSFVLDESSPLLLRDTDT